MEIIRYHGAWLQEPLLYVKNKYLEIGDLFAQPFYQFDLEVFGKEL